MLYKIHGASYICITTHYILAAFLCSQVPGGKDSLQVEGAECSNITQALCHYQLSQLSMFQYMLV
jgi:hypothetical protein